MLSHCTYQLDSVYEKPVRFGLSVWAFMPIKAQLPQWFPTQSNFVTSFIPEGVDLFTVVATVFHGLG